MKIISNKKISKNIIQLINRVSKDYNLSDWKLEIWNIKGENECIRELKLIYLYHYSDDLFIKKWFLHEIAHLLLPDNMDNHTHGKTFLKKLHEIKIRYG